MAWTEERIDALKQYWDEGLSASQIAAKLGEGVTRNAVIGKAHRLGLKSRPSPLKSGAGKAKAPTRKARERSTKKRLTTLLDLSDRMCKWPNGHPGDEDFHFCGKPSEPGMPYCAAHCAVAYQAQPIKRDRRVLPKPIIR